MRVIDAPQGSPVWLKARLGKPTASRIKDVMATLKNGGESSQRRTYREELRSERLTGLSVDHFTNPEMQHGTEFEPFARAAYEMETGFMVDTVGLVLHPTMDFAAASPDGLVGDDGLIEIKCPKTSTHTRWRLAKDVPEEHQLQMLWQMACTGRAWCDFVSYDPRLEKEGLELFIVRFQRDEERIAQIEAEVRKLNEEIEAEIADLRKFARKKPSPKPTLSAYDSVMEMMEELIP